MFLILIKTFRLYYCVTFEVSKTTDFCDLCEPLKITANLATYDLVISALREKCPNMELFLVRIFPHTLYLSVFSPNAGKYGPEMTAYLDTFHAVLLLNSTLSHQNVTENVHLGCKNFFKVFRSFLRTY